jgi:YHS domain-containing protein
MANVTERGLDPMCGMWLTASDVIAEYVYPGQVYRFCSQECYARFAKAPEQYITNLAHSVEAITPPASNGTGAMGKKPAEQSALQALDMRFAKSEISQDGYRNMDAP